MLHGTQVLLKKRLAAVYTRQLINTAEQAADDAVWKKVSLSLARAFVLCANVGESLFTRVKIIPAIIK